MCKYTWALLDWYRCEVMSIGIIHPFVPIEDIIYIQINQSGVTDLRIC